MRFSLVIPLAPERQIKILDSIKKTNFPKEEYEIIVEVGKNPSINRNKGIKKSKGEIIGILDDDADVRHDILNHVDQFFKQNPNHQILGGPQLTTKNETFFGKYSGYSLASFFGTMGMSARYKQTPLNLNADESHLTSANLWVKKEVFDKIKPFNPNLFPGEDPEFLARAKRNGFNIASNPNIIIYHKRRSNAKDFFKQLFTYGKTRLKKESLSNTNPSPIFYAPALFVLYLIFMIPLSLISNLILFPFFFYILGALAFSSIIGVENKDPLAIILVPFMFFLLHIAYGVGMLNFLGGNISSNISSKS